MMTIPMMCLLEETWHTLKAMEKQLLQQLIRKLEILLRDCYVQAKAIIEEHMEQLHASAKLLLEKEKINQEEFEALF